MKQRAKSPASEVLKMVENRLTLKRKISSGGIAFGSWAQMGSPEAVEMIGSAGFDLL